MYLIKSENRPTIVNHFCNTEKLANIIKDYIEQKYECKCIISQPNQDKIYFDPGGGVFINPDLVTVQIGEIETNIDFVDILVSVFNNKSFSFEKGFARIGTFFGNIALSEEEYLSTKSWIENNKKLIKEYTERANEIINGIIKSVQNKNKL